MCFLQVEVEYRISKHDSPHPGTVFWFRKITERCVDEQAKVREKYWLFTFFSRETVYLCSV